jgi:adenylylsulfate kinase-like enzyme
MRMCVESVLWHKHLPVRCTALVAAISPYRATREELRKNSTNFIEVYVNTPLEVCERRDPKGLSERARNKQISSFTGMDDPYEPPLKPASDHGHFNSRQQRKESTAVKNRFRRGRMQA